jgi:serine protease Do
MNTKWIVATLVGLSLTAAGFAQDEVAPKAKKNESITIRKNGTTKEKITVVIDGDKVTVNGKPVDEWKDSDIEVLKGKKANIKVLAPHLMNGNHELFSGDFAFAEGNKAFLGVTTDKVENGAKITNVTKGSSAEKAGLKDGDIITKVGDTKIEDGDALYKAIGKYKPEEKVTVNYLRDGKENTTTAVLGKNTSARSMTINGTDNFNFRIPSPMISGQNGMHFNYSNSGKPKLGLQIQDVEEGTGVKIIDVDDESVAEKAGLKENDIIIDIDGKEIKNVDDLRAKIKEVKEGDSFKIKYKREGKTQSADVKFPKKLKTANL